MLTMLLTSCLTLQVNAPKVSFPDPPDPAGAVEKDDELQMMLVPFWYWNKLATFYIDYDAALERYEYWYEDKEEK